MNDPGKPALVVAPFAAPRRDVADLLRNLAADAERGEIIGVCVVTELAGGRIGTAHAFEDVHRALGGLERLRVRLLNNT